MFLGFFTKVKGHFLKVILVILLVISITFLVFGYIEETRSPVENFQKGLSYYQKGNFQKAKPYLIKAFFGNLPEAGLVLGEMSLNGKGEKTDPNTASVYYEKSARLGNPDASYALALMYNRGFGVPKSKTDALMWAITAAAQGNIDAAFTAAVWIERGYRSDFGFTEARALYIQAAEMDHLEAIQSLIAIYSKGVGVPKNPKKAEYWLGRLADLTRPSDNSMKKQNPIKEPVAKKEAKTPSFSKEASLDSDNAASEDVMDEQVPKGEEILIEGEPSKSSKTEPLKEKGSPAK
ncbi:MAG: tetratricopeptide repeat protein [Alphaproteobacteria bacterium]|nr:tetratricopeptide repeat protein [Alphaproteobacteria bacterium]